MFEGKINEESEESSISNEDIPDEFEEIKELYATAHEELVQHVAESHKTLVKQCSIRLLSKSLASLVSITKRSTFEFLKVHTLESIIEGKNSAINTYEGQRGETMHAVNDMRNNLKVVRPTLGSTRASIGGQSFSSRFYNKAGDNLSQKMGSASLVQSLFSYIKEQKEKIEEIKRQKIKNMLRFVCKKRIAKAIKK